MTEAGERPPIPDGVLGAARPVVGVVCDITTLGGMSGSRVVRIAGPVESLVAKGGVSGRERAVYERLSAALAKQGVRIPRWYGTVNGGGDAWLLLEDVPKPLPRERWLAHAGVMATLRRLHTLPVGELDVLPDWFRPVWTGAMDRAALGWLGDDSRLAGTLHSFRRAAAGLFEPLAVISGDPNPLNWGLSVDGELVLMDWERVGLGHPALDVAITLPGLPSLVEFEAAAHAYRWNDGPGISVQQLVLAKLWTCVELLATTPRPIAGRPDDLPEQRKREAARWLAAALPGWLGEVADWVGVHETSR